MAENLDMQLHKSSHPYLSHQELDHAAHLHPDLQAQINAHVQLQMQSNVQTQLPQEIRHQIHAQIRAQLNLSQAPLNVPAQHNLDARVRAQHQLLSQPETQQFHQQFPPEVPPVPSLSPLSSLSQFAQVPQQQLVTSPFDEVLNVPFSVPSSVIPPPPLLPMGLSNPYMGLLNSQLINPFLNPLLPLGLPPLAFLPIAKTPVPLMSLRIPTPPSLRAHPYQRERFNEMLKKTRERYDVLQPNNEREQNDTRTRNGYSRPLPSESEPLGATLRKEAEQSEKEDSWRRRR